jgi:hypothetical protein
MLARYRRLRMRRNQLGAPLRACPRGANQATSRSRTPRRSAKVLWRLCLNRLPRRIQSGDISEKLPRSFQRPLRASRGRAIQRLAPCTVRSMRE